MYEYAIHYDGLSLSSKNDISFTGHHWKYFTQNTIRGTHIKNNIITLWSVVVQCNSSIMSERNFILLFQYSLYHHHKEKSKSWFFLHSILISDHSVLLLLASKNLHLDIRSIILLKLKDHLHQHSFIHHLDSNISYSLFVRLWCSNLSIVLIIFIV